MRLMMPHNEYSDAAVRRTAGLLMVLLGGTINGEFLQKILVENGVFVLVVILAFFGSIGPLVKAKADQTEGLFYRIYSAFYSWLVASVIMAGLHYGVELNIYTNMIIAPILGAVMELILNKFFAQIEGTTDFLSIFKLAGQIVSAVWDVIKAAKNETDNTNSNENNSTSNEN